MIRLLRFLLCFLCSGLLWTNSYSDQWYAVDDQKHVTINVELFLSTACPYCHLEIEFFRDMESTHPWLHVHRHLVNEDRDALIRFSQLLTELQFNDFAVPSAFFCNSRWVGFSTAETTGHDLLKALNYCKHDIEANGELSQEAQNVLQRWANANQFNTGITERPSLTKYLLIVSLLDTMNPCSLFCFAGFLAVLWIQYSKKNQWVSGFLFILAVAVIHYTQQTQTNLFFQTLPWLRGLAVFLGLASVYLVVRYYKKKPLSSAPMLFAWVFCFAFLTQTYQQTCVMNWSYIFQQWLATQSLSSGQKTVLQVIYQIIYIMPLVLILCGYVLLQPWKRLLAIKPHLETSGLLFILVISLFLVIRPMALANYLLSFVLLSLLFIAGVVWFHWVIKPKQ